MREFFTSKWIILVLLIAVLCLGAMIYTSVSDDHTSPATKVAGVIVSPVQNLISWVADGISHAYNYTFRYGDAIRENEELKERIRDLEHQLRDAKISVEENESLRKLLDIKERNTSFGFEIAEVIARNTSNFGYTLSLDKGSLAGIERNDTVITEEGMVGFVSDVGPNYSVVTTIVDPEMQAGAILSRTREVAVAKGDFSFMEDGILKLTYLKKDAQVVIGDTVETSGTGGLFPKGLLIGTVERILPEEHGISNYAIVRPSADIDGVKKVFVITTFDISG